MDGDDILGFGVPGKRALPLTEISSAQIAPGLVRIGSGKKAWLLGALESWGVPIASGDQRTEQARRWMLARGIVWVLASWVMMSFADAIQSGYSRGWWALGGPLAERPSANILVPAILCATLLPDPLIMRAALTNWRTAYGFSYTTWYASTADAPSHASSWLSKLSMLAMTIAILLLAPRLAHRKTTE